jgi:YD repeat-containing protein
MQATASVGITDSLNVGEVTYSGKDVSGNWQNYSKVEFEYYANERLKSRTVTDLTSYASPPRTWAYSFTYHGGSNTIVETITQDGPLAGTADQSVETFDAQGRLTSFVNALGHTTTYSAFNATGSPGIIVGPNNEETRLEYDALGRLMDLRVGYGTAEETHTQIDYYLNGLVKKTTIASGTPNEMWLQYEYNDARQLTKIENNAGEAIALTPQALDGQWTSLEVKDSGDAVKQKKNKVFDDLGRLEKALDASGLVTRSEFSYDFNSNIKSTIQGGVNTTEITRLFDTLDRLKQINHAGGGISKYEYDEQGNLAKVTDQRNLVTIYQYDGFGSLMTVDSPDTGITIFAYDVAGNQTQQTDARVVVVNYSYDVLNRLTSITYPASTNENITFTYDSVAGGNKGRGRLTSVTDQSGSTAYVYDLFGRLSNKTIVLTNGAGSTTYPWSFTYDSVGNLLTTIYPSGRQVRYGRDNLGRISALYTTESGGAEQLIANTFTYQPFGSVKSHTFDGGLVQTVGRDLDYRIDTIDSSNASSILNWDFSYLTTDNISGITDTLDPANTQSFTYDAESRLDAASGSYGVMDYGYDGVGNRTSLDINNGAETKTLTYSSTSNQLLGVTVVPGGTTTFTYTDSGNMETDSSRTTAPLAYNDANRLINATTASGAADYQYNALGQRVIKLAASPEIVNQHYHYNNSAQVLAEHLSDGTVVKEYIYANGQLITIAVNPDLDDDGLDDSWEALYFSDLAKDGTDDTDGDGVSDLNEFLNGLDPTLSQVDGDADGLDDVWEIQYLGDLSQDGSGDADGDGINNVDEFLLGTNPTEANIHPAVLFLILDMM